MSGASRSNDPEVDRLLLEEFRRLEHALSVVRAPEEQRRAVHSLKGSTGVAGEYGLWEALSRIERRLAAGDHSALGDVRVVLADATTALQARHAERADTGQRASGSAPVRIGPAWPEPPPDLRADTISPSQRPQYTAEMQERLSRIDAALATTGDEAAAVAAAYREVHAMKAAAMAASDDATAWFCHGLEERLRADRRSDVEARRSLDALIGWRNVLAELVTAPDRALKMLRTVAGPQELSASVRETPSSLPPSSPSVEQAVDTGPRASEDATLRVPAASLDRLFERMQSLDRTHARVAQGASEMYVMASHVRELRSRLTEATRALGATKAPSLAIGRMHEASRTAALLSERLEQQALSLSATADRLRGDALSAQNDLAMLRTTKVSGLFDRVAAAVHAQARREGREVRLRITGGETPIDRRAAQLLFDPVLQLAHNAVAHGIESAAERAMRGKPRVGLVHLHAEMRSGTLTLRVQDDGAGVDIADVRARAVARGVVSAATARTASRQTLLALLFAPGFTTRDSADLLAGRGVGLGLALQAVRRLGGTIRLASEQNMGLTATIRIPLERAFLKVLWVDAGGVTYALAVRHVRRVVLIRSDEAAPPLPLTHYLAGLRAIEALRAGPPRQQGSKPRVQTPAVELDPVREGDTPPTIAVDLVGAIEEVSLRPLTRIVTAAGPYLGAIVRGDDIRLCLDAHALAELAVLAERM